MNPSSPALRFGDFVMQPRLQRLVCDGRIVPLKPKAYDLLCVLLDHRDRVMSRAELMDWLWPRQDVGEANLSQTVYELRRALGDPARQSRWIESLPRRGYRFAGEVLEQPDEAASGQPPVIAVLPFQSLSGRPEHAYLELGVADSVITGLARGSEGHLVMRTISTVASLVGQVTDPLQAGRRLGSDVVVEGTIQHIGERIRLNARAHEVGTGKLIGVASLETEPAQLFEAQDRLAEQIKAELGILATPSRVTSTPDNEARTLYLKARYCWHRWTVEAWYQAIRYLEDALELAPDFARAHALMASAWSTLGIFGGLPPREAFALARQSARAVVSLDESLSEGHEALGAIALFHDWDLAAALRCLDQAIELSPDSANAHHLRALTLAIGGHNDIAVAEMQRALRADPVLLIANCDLGIIHYWGRRFEEAERCLRNILAMDVDFAHAHNSLAYVLLATGRNEEALDETRYGLAMSGRADDATGQLALMLGRSGHVNECREVTDRLIAGANARHVDPFELVLAHIGLDDPDGQLEWLERAFEWRSRDVIQIAAWPLFDGLRERLEWRKICVPGARKEPKSAT